MSKYVENYWVKKFPCGIVELLINTTDKWLYYHQYDDYQYEIRPWNYGKWKDAMNTAAESILNLEPGCLQLEEGVRYVKTVQQDDDQIAFYFIPIHLVHDNQKSHIIYQSKTKNNVSDN